MNVETPVRTTFVNLTPGDPFPWFAQRCPSHPRFNVDTMAGRYLVFCFFGSAAGPEGRAAIDAVLRHRDRFDDSRACFFGVTIDPGDEAERRVRDSMPGIRFLLDFDRSVSRVCGAVPEQTTIGQTTPVRRFWLVVDPTLHVLAKFPFRPEDASHDAVFAFLDRLPQDPGRYAGFEIPAPVLILPNVFEPELCRRLIDLYDRHGGEETGVMRAGVGVLDASFKRRRDYHVTDPDLVRHIRALTRRRVIPEIEKLFFMRITHMERYIVGCYAAEDGGIFRPHRDNNPGVTAHRRFAVSINLNGDFEGGEVSFPEYNPRGHKAPPGWAVVFPCAILHKVTQVTKGRRYAFLPFVYDDAGAKIREDYLRSQQQPADGGAKADPVGA